MGWLDVADHAIRAARDEFGRTIEYTHTAQAVTVTIQAPLDITWAEAANGEAAQSARVPILMVRLADLSYEPQAGDEDYDTLVYAGTTYEVVDVQPDGNGAADLILRRA